jgi:metal-dependent amidase/aminoacylase/carboxypeptidase family protein
MRKIKSTLKLILFISLIFTINACKNCDGENPRCRIINNGTKVISVQIKTSGGNTENINNVQAGVTSEYRSFAAGNTTFTISVGNDIAQTIIQMSNCYQYDIAIDKNNIITTTPTDRNE